MLMVQADLVLTQPSKPFFHTWIKISWSMEKYFLYKDTIRRNEELANSGINFINWCIWWGKGALWRSFMPAGKRSATVADALKKSLQSAWRWKTMWLTSVPMELVTTWKWSTTGSSTGYAIDRRKPWPHATLVWLLLQKTWLKSSLNGTRVNWQLLDRNHCGYLETQRRRRSRWTNRRLSGRCRKQRNWWTSQSALDPGMLSLSSLSWGICPLHLCLQRRTYMPARSKTSRIFKLWRRWLSWSKRLSSLTSKSSHAQGFAQLRVASKENNWNVICRHRIYSARWMYHPFSFLKRLWCLQPWCDLANLLFDEYFGCNSQHQ